MKIIIAGGRDFNDYPSLKDYVDKIIVNVDDPEVVSGTASGADSLGERYALEKGIPVKRFPADWERYGKSAGYKRNLQMGEYADALIAFWDGKSRGTKHMIEIAQRLKLNIRVYKY